MPWRWRKICAGLTGCSATGSGRSGRHAAVLNAGLNGIYLSRSSLDAAFDDDGQQVAQVMARLTGSVQGLETLLNRSGWQMAIDVPSGLYVLTAEKYELTMGP